MLFRVPFVDCVAAHWLQHDSDCGVVVQLAKDWLGDAGRLPVGNWVSPTSSSRSSPDQSCLVFLKGNLPRWKYALFFFHEFVCVGEGSPLPKLRHAPFLFPVWKGVSNSYTGNEFESKRSLSPPRAASSVSISFFLSCMVVLEASSSSLSAAVLPVSSSSLRKENISAKFNALWISSLSTVAVFSFPVVLMLLYRSSSLLTCVGSLRSILLGSGTSWPALSSSGPSSVIPSGTSCWALLNLVDWRKKFNVSSNVDVG